MQDYDRVYQYPERQSDLRYMEQLVTESYSGHRVLELAAGTGYWTQFIAERAASITAIDGEPAQLEILAQRNIACPMTSFVWDIYALEALQETGFSLRLLACGGLMCRSKI